MIAIAILGIAATRSIEMQQRENLLHTVDADIAGLTDVIVQGGVEELKRRIGDRTQLAAQIEPAAYYFLADSTGHRLAGNLTSLPTVDAARSQSSVIDTSDGKMILRATRLRGNLTLAAARSLFIVGHACTALAVCVPDCCHSGNSRSDGCCGDRRFTLSKSDDNAQHDL